MRPFELVDRIEREGGCFRIHGCCVQAENVPARYQRELEKQGYAVKAEVLERRASQRWAAVGYDWYVYPEDYWTQDNELRVVKLSSDWAELKELVRKARAGREGYEVAARHPARQGGGHPGGNPNNRNGIQATTCTPSG